jgi:hypothetical protein
MGVGANSGCSGDARQRPRSPGRVFPRRYPPASAFEARFTSASSVGSTPVRTVGTTMRGPVWDVVHQERPQSRRVRVPRARTFVPPAAAGVHGQRVPRRPPGPEIPPHPGLKIARPRPGRTWPRPMSRSPSWTNGAGLERPRLPSRNRPRPKKRRQRLRQSIRGEVSCSQGKRRLPHHRRSRSERPPMAPSISALRTSQPQTPPHRLIPSRPRRGPSPRPGRRCRPRTSRMTSGARTDCRR